jgi:hypothetical protein
VFNSFVRSLTRALRTLLEVTTLNMLLRGDARRMRDDYLDIALSLPFQSEVNTGFGVLAKVYLDALTHLNGGQRVRDANADGVRETKAAALEICDDTFPGVKSPAAEVERGFRFWDVVRARRLLLARRRRSDTCQRLLRQCASCTSKAASTKTSSISSRPPRPGWRPCAREDGVWLCLNLEGSARARWSRWVTHSGGLRRVGWVRGRNSIGSASVGMQAGKGSNCGRWQTAPVRNPSRSAPDPRPRAGAWTCFSTIYSRPAGRGFLM